MMSAPADPAKAMAGIKERDLIKMPPCPICRKPHLAGMPLFYKMTISRCGFDIAAVRRRAGMEMMLGGSGALASVMGPDEDLAKVIDGPHEVFVHEECAGNIGHLLELIPEPEEAADAS
jgi:hypothetical protein